MITINHLSDQPLPDRSQSSRFRPSLSEEEAYQQARMLKALADPTRLRMLSVLSQHAGDVCVNEITELFPFAQPTISHHLRTLREVGLITCQKRGIWAYYFLDREKLALVQQDLAGFLGAR